MTPFWIALQFLTRLPVPARLTICDADMGRSVLFYPVVGFLAGLLLVTIAWLTQLVDPQLTAALVLATWVFVTGVLHLDGLADCADAWVGGHGDRARSLEIMKDPAAGPVAVVMLVLVLLLKFAALTALLRDGAYAPLVFAPLLGRTAIPALMLTTPYVRPQGLGAAMNRLLPRETAVAAVLLSGALAAMAVGATVVLVATGVLWLLRRQMVSRLGGATGDTYGAAVELVETAVLLAVCFLSAAYGF